MTTTPNLGLAELVSGQLQPEVTVNADLTILDAVIGTLPAAFGNNPNTTSLLTYGYYGATLYRSGAPVTIANGTIGLTASATNYVQRTVQGVVSVNTTGYLTGNIPMATVVTSATAITTITDTRPAGYDLTGRVVVEVGAPTGLALATATTGGSIAASTDCTYRISAVYPWGESAASAEVSVTTGGGTATNENTLTWTALPAGAVSANIYGRTAGGELLIANVLAATLTYTDTGSVTPAGALPAGDLTLTPEQYNFGIISLQGALGGNTSVIFPTTAQQWLISNDTTGAYSLLCTVSGGVGPTIPQGQARPVYANGTNLADANTSPFGSDPLTTTGLTWGYFGGNVRNDNVVTVVAPGTVALTASATNYVQISPSDGAISVKTTGFTSGQVPIAALTTSATGILSYTDYRASILDGPGVSVAVANTWTAEQTFDAPIIQTPGQGANNSSPFAQYGDLFSDAIVTTPTPVPATSTTLTGTLPAFDAYVLGQRIAYPGGSYTVGASATSYLDLSNTGVLTVSTSSTVTANSLRLATVTSSATAITGVVVTAATQAGVPTATNPLAPVQLAQVTGTAPVAASGGSQSVTSLSITTPTLTAPCKGRAIAWVNGYNSAANSSTLALTSSAAGLVSVTVANIFALQNALSYLDMAEGDSATFTGTITNTATETIGVYIEARFIPQG
ncbi:MAG: hypothetical protein ACYCY2_01610 [Acidithiobacillus ferriphilus]